MNTSLRTFLRNCEVTIALVLCSLVASVGCSHIVQPTTDNSCPNQQTVLTDYGHHVISVSYGRFNRTSYWADDTFYVSTGFGQPGDEGSARSACYAHFRLVFHYSNPAMNTEAQGPPSLDLSHAFQAWPYLATQDFGYFTAPAPVFLNDPIVGPEWVVDFSDHNSTSTRAYSVYQIIACVPLLAPLADSTDISGSITFSHK